MAKVEFEYSSSNLQNFKAGKPTVKYSQRNIFRTHTELGGTPATRLVNTRVEIYTENSIAFLRVNPSIINFRSMIKNNFNDLMNDSAGLLARSPVDGKLKFGGNVHEI